MCSEFEDFLRHLNFLVEKTSQDRKIMELEDRIAQLEHSLTGIFPANYHPVKRLITERE